MTEPAASITVSVDPTNPGQFFACCGLLELADRLWPGAEGWFAADGRQFNIACGGTLKELLTSLVESDVIPWPETEDGKQFVLPTGLAVQPLIAPIQLRIGQPACLPLVLDAWMTTRIVKGVAITTGNLPWNFWSGQQKSQEIWSALRTKLANHLVRLAPESLSDLFTSRLFQKGRFGFDPGPAWNALDVGFSPNEHNVEVESSPAVELLAAVGLQRFRPLLNDDRDGFDYLTWHHPLTPAVAACAMAGGLNPRLPRYRAAVVSRGQYGALGFSFRILQGDSRE